MKRALLVVGSVLFLTAIAWAGSMRMALFHSGASQDSDTRISATRQNLHAVQMAVESYAMDHGGKYPGQLFPELADGGYLTALPANPYDSSGEAMPEVRAGYELPGGISYVPQTEAAPDGNTSATGYVLLAYGDGGTPQYLRRTRQNFERNLPDASHYNVNWHRVVQSLGGGTVQTLGAGANGGASGISDAPCQ